MLSYYLSVEYIYDLCKVYLGVPLILISALIMGLTGFTRPYYAMGLHCDLSALQASATRRRSEGRGGLRSAEVETFSPTHSPVGCLAGRRARPPANVSYSRLLFVNN